MNRRNWWRGLRRWEKALAAAGIVGTATLVVAAGVQGADEPQTDYCPGYEVTINIDRKGPLDCEMRPGARLNVRLAPTDWTPEAQYACDDMGGRLEHSHGQVVCKDVDY